MKEIVAHLMIILGSDHEIRCVHGQLAVLMDIRELTIIMCFLNRRDNCVRKTDLNFYFPSRIDRDMCENVKSRWNFY